MQGDNKKYLDLLIPAIILAAMGIVFWLIGTLFKIMHWPGAAIALIGATFFLVVGIILLVIWGVLKVNQK